jgi:hypothetical protein
VLLNIPPLLSPPLPSPTPPPLTAEQVHEGGLARAVGPHHRHAAAHGDAQVDVLQPKVVAACGRGGEQRPGQEGEEKE